jgi:hypothetical protein
MHEIIKAALSEIISILALTWASLMAEINLELEGRKRKF